MCGSRATSAATSAWRPTVSLTTGRPRPADAMVVTTACGEHALDAFRPRGDDLLDAFEVPFYGEPETGGAAT